MKTLGTHADRVESFIATIDSYEPTLTGDYEDIFRVFARFISRNLDGRYLERHPAAELLPELEHLLQNALDRPTDAIKVSLRVVDDAKGRRGVVTTCMADQRFIYSIVRLALEYLGIKTYRSINSVIPISRDTQGHIVGVGGVDAPRESFIWLEVDADQLAHRRDDVEAYLRGRLEAVRNVVADFAAIANVVQGLAGRFDAMAQQGQEHRVAYEDNARLLRWLLNEHFVFLGCRYLPRDSQRSAAEVEELGIGRLHDWRGIKIESTERDVLEAGELPPFLWIRKSHTESWVYHAGRTDHILVQCYDPQGRTAGLMVIEGLFSYPALAEPRTSVPLLDRLIERLYTQLQATKGSHLYRTIRNAFNSLPLEYLFALPLEDVRKLIEQVIEVDAQHRSQIHMTLDEAQSTAFIFVALPRSHYSDELRSDIRRVLRERFHASSVDDGVYAGNVESVTFHYFLTGAQPLEPQAEEALKLEIDQMASPWSDRLNDELLRRHGAKEARRLYNLYSDAFPHRYREETSIARAAEDISLIETIGVDNRFECDVYSEQVDKRLAVTRLRLFQTENLLLSDILPILDNFGLIVIDQFPTTVQVLGRSENVVATFRISGVQGMNIDLTTRRSRLRNAIRAVVLGSMGNDPLNRLLLRADIPWPYVVLILAYQSYARQIGAAYAAATVQEALLRHADIVRSLTELFRIKFDPDIEGQSATEIDEKRLQLVERARRAVLVQLESVEDITSDQILRTLYNLVEATVRTNFYSRDLSKDAHLVLKFDPQIITRMPEPRPFREIYVYHPLIAGLHLRGGPVARGGIRWSDRLLDFRTEVLGLMATQNLKNVLIIPRGAKGAFVLRQPPTDLSARRQHADDMYKIFIRGLLDVTDNLIEGKPVTPRRVLRYDDSDHYLVVAADKGTAHLSDTANALAAERNFWLGDAFASGGSKGYDHKKEAITSRGAWECVRRHFREINMNPEVDKIRVVGIGDMSGDVFGNGMLRSKSMQLIAAFDHRNIFLDPNPDPQGSYAARVKLFETPRSSWEDYAKDAISSGGGVYPRGAKSIKLSPEIRAALNTQQTAISGPELVQIIMRAPVDLLWNGGIGTYIKASTETHVDVGDLTNDNVRIDATEVTAKVIGEGGNLGITAAGRVELASRGVRLNTDAVDNSAGVDLSDHEVNLKILFQVAANHGAINPQARDALMGEMGAEVGKSVVANNCLQSRMISLDELRSKRDMARFQRAIVFLADRVPFKRREANLPGDRITRLRMQKNEGFYRPELAVICANAKLDMRQELARANTFSLEQLQEQLFSYWPHTLRQRFEADIRNHPLAINIARTVLTNWIMGDAGCTWLAEMTTMTARSVGDIVQSYFTATDLLNARTFKNNIDALEDKLDANLEYRIRLRLEDALEEICQWLLGDSGRDTPAVRQAFSRAMQHVPQLIAQPDELSLASEAAGAGQEFVTALGMYAHISEILDVALLAASSQQPVERAAQALYLVGQNTGILEMIRLALQSSSTDDMDRPARLAVRAQLRSQWLRIARQLLNAESDLGKVSSTSQSLLESLQKGLATVITGAERPVCDLVIAVERINRQLPSVS